VELVELRVRSRVPRAELDQKVGRILTEGDYNVRLTGPAKVVGPSGQPLAIYLPGALPRALNDEHYPVLHNIKQTTDQRPLASGSRPMTVNKQTSKSNTIRSALMGAFERGGGQRFPYCRTTAWTGQHTKQFESLYPLFRHISDLFQRVPDTPFTTMTVNNTYPTGVHVDKGDLDEGFSCLAVWRRGQYSGGHLTFPEWRLAVDMQDGDLILMDAHQWHGNTSLELESDDAERISLVLYYRTKMLACGTLEEEHKKKMEKKMIKL
jgi:hypothetical protein